jgi:hypothetical protein
MLVDYDPARAEAVLRLLNTESRRAALAVARNLRITRDDLTYIALAGRAGACEPYKYAVHFSDRVPQHLIPRRGETPELEVGPLSADASKFFRKLFQVFEERRLFAAHLFYTADYSHWDLLYFDQRDVEGEHWAGGSHLHYASSRFVAVPLKGVWQRVRAGDTGFLRSVHVPFDF